MDVIISRKERPMENDMLNDSYLRPSLPVLIITTTV